MAKKRAKKKKVMAPTQSDRAASLPAPEEDVTLRAIENVSVILLHIMDIRVSIAVLTKRAMTEVDAVRL